LLKRNNISKKTPQLSIYQLVEVFVVETPRIELGSKQAAKKLSTYLVFVCFFVEKLVKNNLLFT